MKNYLLVYHEIISAPNYCIITNIFFLAIQKKKTLSPSKSKLYSISIHVYRSSLSFLKGLCTTKEPHLPCNTHCRDKKARHKFHSHLVCKRQGEPNSVTVQFPLGLIWHERNLDTKGDLAWVGREEDIFRDKICFSGFSSGLLTTHIFSFCVPFAWHRGCNRGVRVHKHRGWHPWETTRGWRGRYSWG